MNSDERAALRQRYGAARAALRTRGCGALARLDLFVGRGLGDGSAPARGRGKPAPARWIPRGQGDRDRLPLRPGRGGGSPRRRRCRRPCKASSRSYARPRRTRASPSLDQTIQKVGRDGGFAHTRLAAEADGEGLARCRLIERGAKERRAVLRGRRARTRGSDRPSGRSRCAAGRSGVLSRRRISMPVGRSSGVALQELDAERVEIGRARPATHCDGGNRRRPGSSG